MTDTIFIVEYVSDIEKLKETIAKCDNCTVYSLNYFVHDILTKSLIDHKIGEQCLKG